MKSGWDDRPMTSARAAHELALALPDDVIIADESITNAGEVADSIGFDGPDTYYAGRGGGIGQGLE